MDYCNIEDVEVAAAQASDGDATDSTESASSSQLRSNAIWRVNTHEPLPPKTFSVVDLTSPARPDGPGYLGPNPRSVKTNGSRPQASPMASLAASPTPRPQIDHQIRLLPAEIRAPNPQGGQLEFTTHLTQTLKKMTNGEAPLLKHFRPAFVSRDIKVLERGYWQFWIKIAEESIVKESRQPPRATLKLLGSTARKERGKAAGVRELKALWTECEFLQFWKNVTVVIESGKVGWATRMTKELESDSLWKIRAFTWGETLGHIWMLFLVLSDRLTGKVYMEWISGDGAVVVQMSHGKRQSGVWMRKGPEGARGVWSLG
ncbi:uncharacterized protein Z519_07256 [Cladophialophora bantiana CBS 173.52]|uniref:Uncharacterized protein n=1 Tax=Cladophialophora bantiana (strain ATCC 10958 / CBS 173.52 / CDC B-1940 / NIH 8579) TaxID=1442370 RepID=A0A0D2G0K0_CLAB1|nr:uncharacterized protein Z519_07256 [Cladophialophora bantiana CBS 173.52]KIW92272.1 hypothetical protein Z519_07256 [Cladophialophora bantiana CBS 173.52]